MAQSRSEEIKKEMQPLIDRLVALRASITNVSSTLEALLKITEEQKEEKRKLNEEFDKFLASSALYNDDSTRDDDLTNYSTAGTGALSSSAGTGALSSSADLALSNLINSLLPSYSEMGVVELRLLLQDYQQQELEIEQKLEALNYSLRKIKKEGEGIGSKVQAVLFDSNVWNLTNARKWFKQHGFTMPKGKLVHQTDNLIRFRVLTPNYKKYFHRIENIGNGIKFIFAIPK